MRYRTTGGISILALPLLVVACGDTRASVDAAITFDTLPNGAVHVSNPETGMWRDGEGWRLVEDLRIGAMDGEGPEVFGQVRGIEADAEGRIYVLDNQAHAVQVFDADGRHLRTLGGQGEGPGEFRSAFGIRLDPQDRLWVADHQNARYTVFDRDGALVETLPRPIRSFTFIWGGGFDGQSLVEGDVRRDPATGEFRPVFVRLDNVGEPVDTFSLSSFQAPVFEHRTEQSGIMASVPFAPSAHSRLGPEGHLWTGISDRYALHLRTLEGDTVRVVQRDHQRVPVTAEEREEALGSGSIQRIRDAGGRIDESKIPDVKPAFSWFLVDDRDHLWVAVPNAQGEEGTRLDVFDPEGRYLGQIRTPVALPSTPLPVVRGDHLYALVRDNFDVPYAVRLRIER